MPISGRREFLRRSAAVAGLGALLGCSRVPFTAQQPTKWRRIGVLSTSASEPRAVRYREAFLGGLRDLGYEDGRNVSVDIRYTQGDAERAAAQAVDLASVPVDVIVLSGDVPMAAARQVTRTIPIVFALNSAPVESGLVTSLRRPGGRFTGLSEMSPDLSGKRLELLRETIPNLARAGVVWDSQFPGPALQYQEIEAAARAVGQELLPLPVRTPDDLQPAIEAARGRADGLVVLTGAITFRNVDRVVDLVTRTRLPAIYGQDFFVEAGGLMSYGANIEAMWRRAAAYVDKILNGVPPGDLPVEQPTRFDLVINLKIAQTLGLTIPPSVLVQATAVIQ